MFLSHIIADKRTYVTIKGYMLYELPSAYRPTGLRRRLATGLGVPERPYKEINRQRRLQLQAQYLSSHDTIYVMNLIGLLRISPGIPKSLSIGGETVSPYITDARRNFT